jgi:hypothetical protein
VAFGDVCGGGEPLAVGWSVIAVVVDAIDCEVILVAMLERPVSERLECLPRLADFDAAPAIPSENWRLRIGASIAHTLPDFVEAGLTAVVRHVGSGGLLDLKTAARICSLQMIAANDVPVAAITSAEPSDRSIFSAPSLLDDTQATEPTTSQIDKIVVMRQTHQESLW